MTTQTYQAASWQMLAQARTELAAGDLRQASEKGWGAAAQIVKAIADRRGWEHKTHRHIWVAVRRLTDENPSMGLTCPALPGRQSPAFQLLREH